MARTAAHLVDHVILFASVRQWVLSLPIPLRLQLAAQPKLVTPMLQIVHRVITRFLLKQAGAKASEADSGAVTLIQRFGSAANLNIHLHCLIVIGLILALNPNARRFWRGLGLGMLIQGALMLPADLLAEDRAAVYVRQLEAMP